MLRGGLAESGHIVTAAVVDEQGRLLAWTGDPSRVTYLRSAAKPFQAIPVVADGAADAFAFTERELAICCGSHSGEPRQVETVRTLLERIGCGEDDLECGAHAPFHEASADAILKRGGSFSRLHNNCSGKHAGMLAWARHTGHATAGYRSPDHPMQRRILREISHWAGMDARDIATAIDGCGVVTFALPVERMAAAFATLAAAADRGPETSAGRVVRAMVGQPYYVAGTDRFCTDLMTVVDGRLLAKEGAEGVLCLADLQRRWGLALKVEDGSRRAVSPATLELLGEMGVLDRVELGRLDAHRVVAITNTRGEQVGEIRASFRLHRSD